MMTASEVRDKFVKFFEAKGHTHVPSSSLVPENDPSVLFTTAGMQQFKPYFTGEPSPYGDKIVSVQKCVRTVDIDEVGDETHTTFFEMLGNFAFNNAVSKREAIQYGYDFITKEMGLEIDYITVFGGDAITPRDEESIEIWQDIDASLKIVEEGREDVFWGPTGEEGPCGPTTEIYINGVEVWNIVFNEYFKDKAGTYTKLDQFGVDTGMGLERLLIAIQNKTELSSSTTKSVYDTDLFASIIDHIKEHASLDTDEAIKSARILADHAKVARFMVAEGVTPSNTGQGYILRRLIRRAILHTQRLGIAIEDFGLGQVIADMYKDIYPELTEKAELVRDVLAGEREKFNKTLKQGLKAFKKGERDAFKLFTTYGFPLEMSQELAREQGEEIDVEAFTTTMAEHQNVSRKMKTPSSR